MFIIVILIKISFDNLEFISMSLPELKLYCLNNNIAIHPNNTRKTFLKRVLTGDLLYYALLSVNELKTILKDKKLKHSGRKRDLIQRILNNRPLTAEPHFIAIDDEYITIDTFITGIKDIDREILLNTHHYMLYSLMQTCKYVLSLLDEDFWRMRLERYTWVDHQHYKLMTFKELYKYFTRESDHNKFKLAAEHGDIQYVQSLLNIGMVATSDILLAAINTKQVEIIKLIICRDNTDILLPEVYRHTPDILNLVCTTGNLTILDTLITNGIINEHITSKPLLKAIYNDNIEIVIRLLDNNIHKRVDCTEGLIVATSENNTNIAKIFLERSIFHSTTINRALNISIHKNNMEIFQYILDTVPHYFKPGSTRDLYTNYDESFRLAVNWCNIQIATILLKYGADIHAYENQALRFAADNGDYAMVTFLLDNGADPSANNYEAKVWASEKGYQEVVNLLSLYQTTD